MFGFECKELFQVSFICILLKLALNTVNAGVHGDHDCDSPQHTQSKTYIQANKVARVEYDVDGISQLTRHCQ